MLKSWQCRRPWSFLGGKQAGSLICAWSVSGSYRMVMRWTGSCLRGALLFVLKPTNWRWPMAKRIKAVSGNVNLHDPLVGLESRVINKILQAKGLVSMLYDHTASRNADADVLWTIQL